MNAELDFYSTNSSIVKHRTFESAKKDKVEKGNRGGASENVMHILNSGV